jgi:cytoskeletal protein RodZ
MSDDTPTQRIDAPPPGGDGTAHEQKKSRALLIALIILGAVLLIAIIILIVVLTARGAGSPNAGATTAASSSSTPSGSPNSSPSVSASATAVAPSPTPTATVAPPPPPPPSNDPVINGFTTASTTVLCNESAPDGDHQPISFSWNTSKAAKVFFGVDTTDASAAPLFDNLPPSGNSNDDFPEGYNHGAYEYPCTAPVTTFTLTVVADNGHKVSKTIKITNKGDQ